MFTWCPMDYDVDTADFVKELDSVPDDYWYYDKHRNTDVLFLYHPGGSIKNLDTTIKIELNWTEAIDFCPNLKSFLKEIVSEVPGKVAVLRTKPGIKMNVHLDAYIEESGTDQYKWRMVIKGDKKNFYFLDENKEKVYPNKQGYQSYIMDGLHPHGIDVSKEEKMTITIGAPWRGNPLPKNLIHDQKVVISKPTLKSTWECR